MQGTYGPAGREDQNTHLHLTCCWPHPTPSLSFIFSSDTKGCTPPPSSQMCNAHFHLPKAPALSEYELTVLLLPGMRLQQHGRDDGRVAQWQSTDTAARGASTQPGSAFPSQWPETCYFTFQCGRMGPCHPHMLLGFTQLIHKALKSGSHTQLILHVSCLLQRLLSLLIMTCKYKNCIEHLNDSMLAFHT